MQCVFKGFIPGSMINPSKKPYLHGERWVSLDIGRVTMTDQLQLPTLFFSTSEEGRGVVRLKWRLYLSQFEARYTCLASFQRLNYTMSLFDLEYFKRTLTTEVLWINITNFPKIWKYEKIESKRDCMNMDNFVSFFSQRNNLISCAWLIFFKKEFILIANCLFSIPVF